MAAIRFLMMAVALAILPVGQIAAMPMDGSGVLGDSRLAPAEMVCVPPGLPPFSSWRLQSGTFQIAKDERERPRIAIFVIYTAPRGQRIHAIWVGDILATVDATPDQAAAPGWHDLGAVTPDTVLRAEPKQTCQWFTPPPKGNDET